MPPRFHNLKAGRSFAIDLLSLQVLREQGMKDKDFASCWDELCHENENLTANIDELGIALSYRLGIGETGNLANVGIPADRTPGRGTTIIVGRSVGVKLAKLMYAPHPCHTNTYLH